MRQTSFPGHELRERREELGISVYEAFRKTRVPAEYIEALERGDLHRLPVACYALGFLKTYCQFLGLGPERYLDCFRACSRPSMMRFLRRDENEEFHLPSWVQEAVTWAVITAVVVLGWLTYSMVVQPQVDTADKRVEAGTVEMMDPPASAIETAP